MKNLTFLSVVSMTLLLSASIESSAASPTTLGYYRFDGCIIKCNSGCKIGPDDGHDAESQGGSGGGIQHVECYYGSNCNTHTCGGEEAFHPEVNMDSTLRGQYLERLHAIQEAAAQGSVDAAVELLTDYSEHTAYNDERHSLQLTGCSKDVLSGNIPLSAAQVTAIESAR